MSEKKYTPMIMQYLEIKKTVEDAILFFRLGDFYEMFFEDAHKASTLLSITLTARDGGGKNRIPMCGVPYHSANEYIKTLIAAGYKVAICEQVTAPDGKGIVQREITRIITPGTVLEEEHNPHGSSESYLASVYKDGFLFEIALLDMSTANGYYRSNITRHDVERILHTFPVSEIVLLSTQFDEEDFKTLQHTAPRSVQKPPLEVSKGYFNNPDELMAIEILISYVTQTQKKTLTHIREFQELKEQEFLHIDPYSVQNLELFTTIRTQEEKGSLISYLNKTITPMGSRFLSKQLRHILTDVQAISYRHELIHDLRDGFIQFHELRDALKNIYDIERIATRAAVGVLSLRDIQWLRHSLSILPTLCELTASISERFKELSENIPQLTSLASELDKAFPDEILGRLSEGNIFRKGYDETYDNLRFYSTHVAEILIEYEAQLREETGIKTLKIGYNKVFGYYIEIRKTHTEHVPETFVRKQTLVSSERYITPHLKEIEDNVLTANENLALRERELLENIHASIQTHVRDLQHLSDQLSFLDFIQSLVRLSQEYNLVRPELNQTTMEMNVRASRHPIVEESLGVGKFIPNDIDFGETFIKLITGPNMAGKSTYMRQVALLVIMNQIGSYVPAESAYLPIYDKIFTRIGASDNLASNESTFMVEMKEANNALQHATERSLILFDEIGRGTATYDGVALAGSFLEYIHKKLRSNTLFSTHYHELTVLEDVYKGLENVHVEAREEGNQLTFLYQLQHGAIDKSYGIHVAQLAGIPQHVIREAKYLLHRLEHHESLNDTEHELKNNTQNKENIQIDIKKISHESKILDILDTIDVNTLTPLEGLQTLHNTIQHIRAILEEDSNEL